MKCRDRKTDIIAVVNYSTPWDAYLARAELSNIEMHLTEEC